MDGQDVNDFETINEDDFQEGDEYAEGEVMQLTAEENHSLIQFNAHTDSVYCVDQLPIEPFDVFASGDGKD